ncbi:MAG TPA: YihY/virulence factor BrkB family protein [Flavisolibacter sp.]
MWTVLKNFWWLLKQAGKGFGKDKIPKLSASLAYYTIFSLGPMLMIVIYLAGFFWGRQAVEGRIYDQVRDLVGNRAALQIQEIIKNASIDGGNTLAVLFGSIMLFIGATTVFSEIQDSINVIWKLKAKAERGWLRMLMHRLLSFSLVVSLGFLLLVSLVINALVQALMEQLQQHFPQVTMVLFFIVNLLLMACIIWLLFATIFKLLPDAVIRLKDVAVGALFTTVLFMLARLGISFYIGRSDIGSTYGTAGSLVVLLLWVYFSAIILYFGAEFTKAYAVRFGSEIKPNSYAITIQTVQVESEKKNVQENERSQEDTEKHLQKKSKSGK